MIPKVCVVKNKDVMNYGVIGTGLAGLSVTYNLIVKSE